MELLETLMLGTKKNNYPFKFSCNNLSNIKNIELDILGGERLFKDKQSRLTLVKIFKVINLNILFIRCIIHAKFA